jgi:hypothetical protein
LSPNDYINKAKHALLTGQPNLAMLYMKRGTEILEQRRRAYLMTSIEGRFVLLGEEVDAMAEQMVRAFQPGLQAVAKAFDMFHAELLQSQYALVSE